MDSIIELLRIVVLNLVLDNCKFFLQVATENDKKLKNIANHVAPIYYSLLFFVLFCYIMSK